MSDDGAAQGGFALNASPSHLLHRAQQAAADRFSDAVGPAGLTLRQFAVLAAAAESPGLSQTDLVRATGVDRSTLAEMVTRMVTRGLLERARSATDARANAVSVSAEGRTALETAIPQVIAVDAAVMDLLPRNRRDGFVELLTRVALSEAAGPRPSRDTGSDEAEAPKKAKKAAKAEKAKPAKSKAEKAEKTKDKKKKKKK